MNRKPGGSWRVKHASLFTHLITVPFSLKFDQKQGKGCDLSVKN